MTKPNHYAIKYRCLSYDKTAVVFCWHEEIAYSAADAMAQADLKLKQQANQHYRGVEEVVPWPVYLRRCYVSSDLFIHDVQVPE